MPANIQKLVECLDAMKMTYLADPTSAVRSSSFIYHLHDYCLNELYAAIGAAKVQKIELQDMKTPSGRPNYPNVPIDPQRLQLMQEATLFGSHKNKDEDIVLAHYANGPQIVIGIRSQMSSVGKNIETYYEGIIGECISIHDRFPMAVIGYVYLLPKNPIKPGLTEEIDLNRAEALFRKITNRTDWHSPHDKYEHFAFIKADFSENPPRLLPSASDLDIKDFFDKLIETYNDRNFFNQV